MVYLSGKNYSSDGIEKKILDILSNNLMSVTQISRELGLRKDVGSAILESMKNQGKLELSVVGKSKVYTLPKPSPMVSLEEKVTVEKNEENIEKKIRTIGIVSGKGGVGKTTTTLNLAGALMDFNQNVISVDADVKMAGLGLHLGIYNFPNTVNTVIKNNTNILESLYIHSTGLRILPASLDVEDVDLSKLYGLFGNFSGSNSIVLIDSPPGLEDNSIQVLNACKEIIVVTTPEFQALTNSIKIIDKAKEIGVKPIGVVVNRYSNRKSHKSIVEKIESIYEIPLLGIIPEDKSIQESIFKGTPNIFLKPYSRSSIVFKQIAATISNQTYQPPKIPFLTNIMRKIS